jgi:hypothetical protein
MRRRGRRRRRRKRRNTFRLQGPRKRMPSRKWFRIRITGASGPKNQSS